MNARAVRFSAAAVLLALAATASPATAAPQAARTVDVAIVNFVYSPTPVTIDPGDTIRWTNFDSAPHSSVTVQPGFVTAILAQGQTTTTLFERPGSFEYICGVHGASMKGTVVVRGTPVDTPRASAGVVGHIVEAAFQEARPDRLETRGADNAVLLYASAALALIALVRFARILRGPEAP